MTLASLLQLQNHNGNDPYVWTTGQEVGTALCVWEGAYIHPCIHYVYIYIQYIKYINTYVYVYVYMCNMCICMYVYIYIMYTYVCKVCVCVCMEIFRNHQSPGSSQQFSSRPSTPRGACSPSKCPTSGQDIPEGLVLEIENPWVYHPTIH